MNRYVHVAVVVVVVVLLVVDIFLALQKYSKNDISCFEFDLCDCGVCPSREVAFLKLIRFSL